MEPLAKHQSTHTTQTSCTHQTTPQHYTHIHILHHTMHTHHTHTHATHPHHTKHLYELISSGISEQNSSAISDLSSYNIVSGPQPPSPVSLQQHSFFPGQTLATSGLAEVSAEDSFIDKGGACFPGTIISFRSACTSAESALPVLVTGPRSTMGDAPPRSLSVPTSLVTCLGFLGQGLHSHTFLIREFDCLPPTPTQVLG